MIAGVRESKLCKGILAALALLACFVALPDADSRSARPGAGDVAARALSATNNGLSQYLDPAMVVYKNATDDPRALESPPPGPPPPSQPPEQFDVCGRPAGFHAASWSRQQEYATCPKSIKGKQALVLTKRADVYGQSGNQLRSFLRAVQYSRDKHRPLVVTKSSWAMKVLAKNFFQTSGANWTSQMEKSLCLKVCTKQPGWKMPRYMATPMRLFKYKSKAGKEDYQASQLQIMRTLWRHHNTGPGPGGAAIRDMCEGINALFPNDGAALYSVIHLRSHAKWRLKKTCQKKGCDLEAAHDMRPEYVKAILAPLGMMVHPIVIITDNKKGSKGVLKRLLGDPDVGPLLRIVPKKARWLGSDMTLAVMANVFIGHPSSTMSGFIGRSRKALGFEHNYIFLAKDENGGWRRVRGSLE